MNIALKWRVLIFASTIVLMMVVGARWQQAHSDVTPYPPQSMVSNTWYGPVLLLLIPLSGAWLSLAAKGRGARHLGLLSAVLLLLICLMLIYTSMDIAGTLPSWIRSTRNI